MIKVCEEAPKHARNRPPAAATRPISNCPEYGRENQMNSPTPTMSRRAFCLCCVGASALAAGGPWLSPGEAFAEARSLVSIIRDAAATAQISVTSFRGNISVLQGSGGNIAVLPGGDGTLLVDGGITASKPRLIEALGTLKAAPVKHLINTHWHFDHTDGNEWLNEQGASIMAHPNTRKHLSSTQRVDDDWNFTFLPSPARALPTEIVHSDRQLHLNGTSIALKLYDPAHTDSDLSVRFVEPDILHTGDTWWNGIYPFIDYSTGGSIDGMIKAADRNISSTSDETIIIPGHGPVGNRKQLIESRNMLSAIRENVAKLKSSGRTLEETITARPTADFDAQWGQFVITPALFTRLVYEGV
jgi:glyoxylase-like metal-dependent hydrolase (beta-lactamase superfamily II)